MQEHGFPLWVREFKFHPVRRFRFDFAWPDQKVACELQGGVWTGGRHSGGAGQVSDFDKLNLAQNMGWIVLQFASSHLRDGTAIQYTKEALGL